MPQYLFTDDNGNTISHTQSAKDEIPAQIARDGVTYNRDIVREHAGVSHHPGCWPLASDSMAVLTTDMKTELSDNQSHGLGIEYKPNATKTGFMPVFNSRKQRAEYMARKGYFDGNAGYSDRAPEHAQQLSRRR